MSDGRRQIVKLLLPGDVIQPERSNGLQAQLHVRALTALRTVHINRSLRDMQQARQFGLRARRLRIRDVPALLGFAQCQLPEPG